MSRVSIQLHSASAIAGLARRPLRNAASPAPGTVGDGSCDTATVARGGRGNYPVVNGIISTVMSQHRDQASSVLFRLASYPAPRVGLRHSPITYPTALVACDHGSRRRSSSGSLRRLRLDLLPLLVGFVLSPVHFELPEKVNIWHNS